MNDTNTPRKLKIMIGRVERVFFPDSDIVGVPAKIDTGAFRSSIWATNVYEKDDTLYFTLLGPESPWYTGKELSLKDYELVSVTNSFGHSEDRYSVYLKVKMGPKSNFTLSDRSMKIYPVLIGRRLLRNRYIVDVSEGEPLNDEENS